MTTPARVIVTGGTGALGQALVLRLLASGARVAVPFRSAGAWSALRDAAANRDALFGLEADLATAEGARRFVEEALAALGTIDAAALAAGGWVGGRRFEESPVEDWARMISQNLDTAVNLCHAVLPQLRRQGGAIVAVGSRAAAENGAQAAAYTAAKCALHAFVLVLALENRRQGVRVNAVLPGTIDTPANRRAMPGADRSLWTSPDAIARTMLFLLSPDSAPVTGALVPVDGAA